MKTFGGIGGEIMSYYFDRDEYNKLIEKYNYKEMLHDAFKLVIAPGFKKHSFKRKGKTFYREREGIIEICEVQYSSGNHRTTASFTFNISIAIPSLYSSLGIQESNKLNTTICGLSFGDVVGFVYDLPTTVKDWYRLEAYSREDDDLSNVYSELGLNQSQIAKQVSFELNWDNRYNVKTGEGFDKVLVGDINMIILPYFNSISNAESLLNHLSEDEPEGKIDEQMMFEVGHLYYNNGEQDKGRKILNRIRNGSYKKQIQYKTELGLIDL